MTSPLSARCYVILHISMPSLLKRIPCYFTSEIFTSFTTEPSSTMNSIAFKEWLGSIGILRNHMWYLVPHSSLVLSINRNKDRDQTIWKHQFIAHSFWQKQCSLFCTKPLIWNGQICILATLNYVKQHWMQILSCSRTGTSNIFYYVHTFS